jgi:hypothetical protein
MHNALSRVMTFEFTQRSVRSMRLLALAVNLSRWIETLFNSLSFTLASSGAACPRQKLIVSQLREPPVQRRLTTRIISGAPSDGLRPAA